MKNKNLITNLEIDLHHAKFEMVYPDEKTTSQEESIATDERNFPTNLHPSSGTVQGGPDYGGENSQGGATKHQTTHYSNPKTDGQGLSQWGDADELRIDIDTLQEHPLDPIPDVPFIPTNSDHIVYFPATTIPRQAIYRPGDTVSLVRYVDVKTDVAREIIIDGRIVSREYDKVGRDIDLYFKSREFVGSTRSIETILTNTWKYGKLGIPTTLNRYIPLFEADVLEKYDLVHLAIEIKIPAEKIVKVEGTVDAPILPAGFDLSRSDIEKYGFVDPYLRESEVISLWEIPPEYIVNIMLVMDAAGKVPEILKEVEFRASNSARGAD